MQLVAVLRQNSIRVENRAIPCRDNLKRKPGWDDGNPSSKTVSQEHRARDTWVYQAARNSRSLFMPRWSCISDTEKEIRM